METRANVVLVHGAWADGSSWSKVIPLLDKNSLNVVAAQLPLTSVEADIASDEEPARHVEGPSRACRPLLRRRCNFRSCERHAGRKSAGIHRRLRPGRRREPGWFEQTGTRPQQVLPRFARLTIMASCGLIGDGFAKAFAADVDPTEARVHGCSAKNH